MPEKPKPKPWNGEDSPSPRDKENVDNYERYKKSRTNPEPDMIDNWVANARRNAKKPLPKGMTYAPMAGSPSMASVVAKKRASVKVAKRMKSRKSPIQGSPTN